MARTVLKSKYRSDSVRLFMQDVLDNDYYLFVAGQEEEGVINSRETDNDFFEKLLFGKKIKDEEIFFMIKNYPWEFQKVYTQYDDRVDLADTNYYAVVYPENNRTGNYRLYKCLFNNYGAPSTSPPNYTDGQPNQEYETSDGYVWKFMYEIPVTRFDRFNAIGYVPIEKVFNQDDGTIDPGSGDDKGPIDQIFVENNIDNIGYDKVFGKVRTVVRQRNSIQSIILKASDSSADFDAISNYYSSYSLYITSYDSDIFEIDTYTFNSNAGEATVTLRENTNANIIQENATFQIFPRIEILGDGTGAQAIPIINDAGTITKVKMIERGSGYTRAIARVQTPKFGFDTSDTGLDVPAILRPIISPPNGHGTNLIDELSCKHALIYSSFEEEDNEILPTSNRFANIALIRNPKFKISEGESSPNVFDNRIRLSLPNNTLTVDEIVTQIETDTEKLFYDNNPSDGFKKVRFSGRIHEVTNDDVYISQYAGPFPHDVDDSLPSFGGQDFSDISLDVELPLYSSQDEILNINKDGTGVTISPYFQKTGDIYYHSSLFPLERTEDSREQFKIILEF